MTVPNANRRTQVVADGTVGPFTYTFQILASSHLEVYVSDADESNEVLKTEVTDYNVAGVGDPNGGTITFVASKEPDSTDLITFIRNVPITQLTDYVENDPFPADAHETALDKLTHICQQLTELTDRAIIQSVSSSSSGLTWPNMADTNNHGKAITIIDATTLGVSSLGGGSAALTAKGELLSHNGTADVALGSSGEPEGTVLAVQANQPTNFIYKRVAHPNSFRGLYMETPYDSISVTGEDKKIHVLNLDEIVTQKSTLVSIGRTVLDEYDNKGVIDFATTGLNGLNAGSATNGRWYKLFAIFEGPDSSTPDDPDTPANLAFTAVEADPPTNIAIASSPGATFAIGSAAGNQNHSQTFTTGFSGNARLYAIELPFWRVGSPSGNLWLTVEGDTGGSGPDGVVIATSNRVKVDSMTTDTIGDGVTFVFDKNPALANATLYHVKINRDYAISAPNHCAAKRDTGNPYAGGSRWAFDGATWTEFAGDDVNMTLIMKEDANDVYPDEIVPDFTQTGYTTYTEYTHIGWARYDDNRLGSFIAVNHDVQCLWTNGDASAEPWFHEEAVRVPLDTKRPLNMPLGNAWATWWFVGSDTTTAKFSIGNHQLEAGPDAGQQLRGGYLFNEIDGLATARETAQVKGPIITRGSTIRIHSGAVGVQFRFGLASFRWSN